MTVSTSSLEASPGWPGQPTDPASQPRPSQAPSSTPGAAAVALPALPLSPLTPNTMGAARKSPRKLLRASQAVVVSSTQDVAEPDDTFDQLMRGPAVRQVAAVERQALPLSPQLFSQEDSPPALLSPETSKSILRAVASPLASPLASKTKTSHLASTSKGDLTHHNDSPSSGSSKTTKKPLKLMTKSLRGFLQKVGEGSGAKGKASGGKRVSWEAGVRGEPKTPGWSKVGLAMGEMAGVARATKYPQLDLSTSTQKEEVPEQPEAVEMVESEEMEGIMEVAEVAETEEDLTEEDVAKVAEGEADSIPSIISASVASGEGTLGLREVRARLGLGGSGSEGGEAEVAVGGSGSSTTERRASFRLDASTLELEAAAAAPDTLEMSRARASPAASCFASPRPPGRASTPGSGRRRVAFRLQGRVAGGAVVRRGRGVSFLQLGRLAAATRSLGPSLRELVSRRGGSEAGSEFRTPRSAARLAVASWLTNMQTPESLHSMAAATPELRHRSGAPPSEGLVTPTAATPSLQATSAPSQHAPSVVTPSLQDSNAPTPSLTDSSAAPPLNSSRPDAPVASREVVHAAPSTASVNLEQELEKLVETEEVGLCTAAAEGEEKKAVVISEDEEEAEEVTEAASMCAQVMNIEEESSELPEVEEAFMADLLSSQVSGFTQELGWGAKRAREEDSEEEVVQVRAGQSKARRIESDEEEEQEPDRQTFGIEEMEEVEDNRTSSIKKSSAGPTFENSFEKSKAAEPVASQVIEVEESQEEVAKEIEENQANREDEEKYNDDTLVDDEDEDADLTGESEPAVRTTQETLAAMAAAEDVAAEVQVAMDGGAEVLASQRFIEETRSRRSGQASQQLEGLGLEDSWPSMTQYDAAAADQHTQPEEAAKGGTKELGETEESGETEEVGETEVVAATEDLTTIPDSDSDMFSQSSQSQASPYKAAVASSIPALPHIEEVVEVVVEDVVEEAEEVDTSDWRFVLSNLSSSGRALVPGWVEGLGCRGVHTRVEAGVTHVLVSTAEDLQAVRTLKYLQAVASGILVVSELWVEACRRDPASLGRAAEWEVRDEEMEGVEGPRLAREARERGEGGRLMAGMEVLVREELEGLDRPAVVDLLTKAGARTVNTITSFNFSSSGGPKVELVDSVSWMEEREEEVVRQLRNSKVVMVEKDWLLDTICCHQIKPVSGEEGWIFATLHFTH